MSSTKVRTIVAFSDDKHCKYIPDDVLYINTTTKTIQFNRNDDVYFIDLSDQLDLSNLVVEIGE